MEIGDAHARGVLRRAQGYADIEDVRLFRQLHLHGELFQHGADGGDLRFGDGGDDLQLFGSVSRGDARADGGGDAAQPARVRDDHALDVFEDVAADGDFGGQGRLAEQVARGGGGKGYGDGFGAAHGGQQLFAEDAQIALVDGLIHGMPFLL